MHRIYYLNPNEIPSNATAPGLDGARQKLKLAIFKAVEWSFSLFSPTHITKVLETISPHRRSGFSSTFFLFMG